MQWSEFSRTLYIWASPQNPTESLVLPDLQTPCLWWPSGICTLSWSGTATPLLYIVEGSVFCDAKGPDTGIIRWDNWCWSKAPKWHCSTEIIVSLWNCRLLFRHQCDSPACSDNQVTWAGRVRGWMGVVEMNAGQWTPNADQRPVVGTGHVFKSGRLCDKTRMKTSRKVWWHGHRISWCRWHT